MRTITPLEMGTFIRAVSKAFRSKMTITFIRYAGMSSAMPYVRNWLLAQKIGSGVPFGDGFNSQSLSHACSHHGQCAGFLIG